MKPKMSLLEHKKFAAVLIEARIAAAKGVEVFPKTGLSFRRLERLIVIIDSVRLELERVVAKDHAKGDIYFPRLGKS